MDKSVNRYVHINKWVFNTLFMLNVLAFMYINDKEEEPLYHRFVNSYSNSIIES